MPATDRLETVRMAVELTGAILQSNTDNEVLGIRGHGGSKCNTNPNPLDVFDAVLTHLSTAAGAPSDT